MTRWEYRSVTIDVAGDDNLAALGAAGWEAYAAVPAALHGPGYYTLEQVMVLLKRAVDAT